MPAVMSRPCPYQKNDIAHVEQKTFAHVGECFGYDRIKDLSLVDLTNRIYRDYWNPLHNFFYENAARVEGKNQGADQKNLISRKRRSKN